MTLLPDTKTDSAPLRLRLEPDPVLRVVCEEVSEIGREVGVLVQGMIARMDASNGVGLAAPQVGRKMRLFVTRAPGDRARVFINPTLISASQKEVEMEEGCLSIPGIYAALTRPSDIIVQAYDEQGRGFSLEATGMLARVVLHEQDHLEGVLFWDHLPLKQRTRLQKQYRR